MVERYWPINEADDDFGPSSRSFHEWCESGYVNGGHNDTSQRAFCRIAPDSESGQVVI
jgi:hypothetical protein